MNVKEIRKLGEDWLTEKEEGIALNLRCKAQAKKFSSGALNGLKPIWHLKKENIDFLKQKDQLDEDLLVEGYTIIPAINFIRLLNSFYANQGSFINDKKIINRDGFIDTQLCRIVEYWQNEEALIPPIIIFLTRD